jgi:hypothetical protein
MRFKHVGSFTTLAVFIATLAIGGCQGTNVPLADAPPTAVGEVKPLPKKAQQGGGPSSSGNMKRNPGADPLSKR